MGSDIDLAAEFDPVCPNGRDGSFEGRFPSHFVPGYDRLSLRDALADISQNSI